MTSKRASTTDLGSRPVEGRITDDAIELARAMIGTVLRPEGPYIQDATLDTIRTFSNGIGDVNPLFRDAEHGRKSRHGSIIAHPLFPFAYGWPGRTRWGLPGVHGFFAGNDWEFFRNVRPGDRLTCIERVVGVEEKASRLSGRLVIQYVQATYVNQRDETVAEALGWCTRHEREASRASGKHQASEKYEYSQAELRKIQKVGLAERESSRGPTVRYVEDVEVGQDLPSIVRGPLSLMDTIGFLVGCGRGHTHGLLLEEALSHPGHFFRNTSAGGGIEYTGIGHHREEIAREVGAPGTYDYGPQRVSWLASLVTNWMGDAAFLKRLRVEMRGFNTVGDTTWCKGQVAAKRMIDGYGLVDLEIWAESQTGERTAPGLASIILPSRDPNSRPVIDGSPVQLRAGALSFS